jgi:2Fe-2S ferredoxin
LFKIPEDNDVLTLPRLPGTDQKNIRKGETEMPLVTIMPSGKTRDAESGTRILDILIEAGENIGHKCEGKASCGTCHIFVTEGRKTLSKTERLENERLDAVVGVGSKSRLACQAKLGAENVTVELLGFASGL